MLAPDIAELDRNVFYGTVYAGNTKDKLVYNITLVQLSDNFKKCLTEGYKQDPYQAKVTELLNGGNAYTLLFAINDGLLYIVDYDNICRLYIPKSVVKDLFQLAHDNIGYPGYYRVIARLCGFAIQKLIKEAKQYVKYCYNCQVNRIRCYLLYSTY